LQIKQEKKVSEEAHIARECASHQEADFATIMYETWIRAMYLDKEK